MTNIVSPNKGNILDELNCLNSALLWIFNWGMFVISLYVLALLKTYYTGVTTLTVFWYTINVPHVPPWYIAHGAIVGVIVLYAIIWFTYKSTRDHNITVLSEDGN